jgi:hypothetical protein
MKKFGHAAVISSFCAALVFGADPALTIYNQNFAVIRETLPLDLKAGNNVVRFSDATAEVEPSSVILRDPAGRNALQVVEQNYRNDPVSQERLLGLYEGKTIDFYLGPDNIVSGRIVRSGYVPPNRTGMGSAGAGQPIIEVGGKLQFTLPGQPHFPALGDDTILKPALDWILYSAQPARFEAELSYVSGGMTWSSDYNIVAPETGDTLDLVGWVTLDNQSGKQFDHAHIKLMAGNVNKVQPQNQPMMMASAGAVSVTGVPQVTEKAFEDYHLYTLPQPTTIHDRETKQVEFLRASGIQSKRLYVYDGATFDRNYNVYQDLRQFQQYGTQSNPHVWVMREFSNSVANHLGIPLPQGRLRFYRRDQDGQLEFTGENQIEHTPKDEIIRLYTGNAFDISGERRQTSFKSQMRQPGGFVDESFEIKLRNHKTEPATVRVVEHLYRWSNWAITQESAAHRQTDSKTLEYDVTLAPDEERTLTYTAHYTW